MATVLVNSFEVDGVKVEITSREDAPRKVQYTISKGPEQVTLSQIQLQFIYNMMKMLLME